MSAGPAGAEEHREVVIIGGGMAGVSCALECYDVQLDPIVLEMRAQVGGQINEIPFHVRNVAGGVYDDEHPLPLALERSAAILGDRARLSWPVDQIDLGERWVQSAGRRLAADAIVITTGVGPRRLPAAADGDFGGDVTYQLGSDLERFAGRPGWSSAAETTPPSTPWLSPGANPRSPWCTAPSAWHRGRTSRARSAMIRGLRSSAAGS